ncbi:MAG: hypothetical protein A2Z16_09410 [Chloroflexi bacterium RBG_16_54_18]|nr:MAG: hypothetical protein A2Z16_09410 [Chloroflexi bacterium RBG_16_54_18]
MGVLTLEIEVERVAVAVGGNQTKVGVAVAESQVGVWVVNPLPAELVPLQAEFSTIISSILISWAAVR